MTGSASPETPVAGAENDGLPPTTAAYYIDGKIAYVFEFG
jgi:hypothetical protein